MVVRKFLQAWIREFYRKSKVHRVQLKLFEDTPAAEPRGLDERVLQSTVQASGYPGVLGGGQGRQGGAGVWFKG